MKSFKAIFRRGHTKDSSGRDSDNISRTSSVTNLESLESQGRTKPPKKSGSKERVDKDGRKGAPKTNNNQPQPHQGLAAIIPQQPQSLIQVNQKVEPGFYSYSADSLQDAEFVQLKRQLSEMAEEKSSLALQLGEQRGQLNSLQQEILKLKNFQEESTHEIEKLSEENTTLRNRLRDVAHSPLSDNEKQQLLFENAHMMQSSSAPASIATNILDDTGGDVTACTTPDWDKHSSSNVSEVSVACLQDKINQMQETHYSTNEELQATLQELTDLQRQLTDLQQENERLNEEKTLMFDSLCRQTERLNDSRQEVENLKQLLYRDRSDETGVTKLENIVEREQKLVELLRAAQEEREGLMVKLEQIQAELHESRSELIDKTTLISQLSERVKTLECSMDAKHAEHKQMDQELAQAKDHCSCKQIEINRLTDLLENARTKINELEQDRTLSDKSELDEMLDNTRKEKDQLESEVAYLKEQLARGKNEIEKLKEQVFVLQEECKVTRNNAKTTQSDLEYKCEKLIAEKNGFVEQLQQFQEAVNELQVQTQCHIEDKRQLSAVLSETQRNLSESERKSVNLETEIQELKKLRAEENEEWEKFQNDLLTSVRVANDFKTEAQQELQKIILENKTFREKIRLLEGQLEKIKGEKATSETQTEVVLSPQLIHLAKNLEFLSSKAILREESRRRNKAVVSLDSAKMDKIFPVLSKERKSKSRESLNDPKSHITHKRQGSLDKESKKSVFKLSRGKSVENLTAPSESDSEFESKQKLEKSKFKFGKSSENLSNFEKEFQKDLQKADFDQTPKKGFRLFERPRKKSKDSIDCLSSNEILDKKSSDMFSRLVKRREKTQTNRNTKFMSVEEEMLMKSLDSWYNNIDKTIPEELLSKEDKAIKQLKVLYESDQMKDKPVAKKPKEQLAISKPLLTSVVQNPKLKQIVKSCEFLTIEEPLRDSVLEYTENITVHSNLDPGTLQVKIESSNLPEKWAPFRKSKSLDNLNYFDADDVTDPYRLKLYRSTETENLLTGDDMILKGPKLKLQRYTSEIHPYDSVSNPRQSKYPDDVFLTRNNCMPDNDFNNLKSLKKDFCPKHPDSLFLENVPHHYEPKVGNDLPKPNIYINYENLDQIVAEIPKNVPESSLTEEQKFALKLKLALEDSESKALIKRQRKKCLKDVEISTPTKESVEKNWKLKKVMLDPHVKNIQEANKRFSEFYIDSAVSSDEVRRHFSNIDENSNKFYQKIEFSFSPELENLKIVFPKKSKSSSSTVSCTTSEPSKTLDPNSVIGDGKSSSNSNDVYNVIDSDLLYNETLKKKDKSYGIKPSEDDIGYNETLVKKVGPKPSKIESVEQDPRIKEAEKQYKKDLQEILNRIKVEEKIMPFLCPTPKDETEKVQYEQSKSILNVYSKKEDEINDIKYKVIQLGISSKNKNMSLTDDGLCCYKTSHISNCLDDSIGISLPDTSRDFIHSSGLVDQNMNDDLPMIFYDNFSLETFLDEERKNVDFSLTLDTKNEILIDSNEDRHIDVKYKIAEEEPGFKDYSHQEILKENKYGVVSPYEVRYSYKNVVSEFKRKCSTDVLVIPTYLKDGESYGIDVEKKNSHTFLSEFYTKHNAISDFKTYDTNPDYISENSRDSATTKLKTEGLSQIDKEMHEIMDKYLNTRASLIVKNQFKNRKSVEDETKSQASPKKYENIANLHELKAIESEYVSEREPNKRIDRKEHETLIDPVNQKHTAEDEGVAIFNFSGVSTDQEIKVNYENLSQDEMDLIKSLKKSEPSRKLSEINERDIFLIEEITKRYSKEDNLEKEANKEEILNIESPHDKNLEGVTDYIPKDFDENNFLNVVQISQNEQLPSSELKPNTKLLNISESDLEIPNNIKESKTLEIYDAINLNALPLKQDVFSFQNTSPLLSPLSPLSDQSEGKSSFKYSLIPIKSPSSKFSSLPLNTRRNTINKSLGNHFQRRSLDMGLKYQSVYGSNNKSYYELSKNVPVKSKTDTDSNYHNGCESNIVKTTEISEPIYANIHRNNENPYSLKSLQEKSELSEKKPLPKPRLKNQGSFSRIINLPKSELTCKLNANQTVTKHDVYSDRKRNVINMINNNQNSCENTKAILDENSPKKEVCTLLEAKEVERQNTVGDLPGISKEINIKDFVQAKVVYLDDSESIIDIVPEQLPQNISHFEDLDRTKENNVLLNVPKSDLIIKRRHELTMNDDNNAHSSKGTLPSTSSIKILGKREELDITKNLLHSEEVEEVPRLDSDVEPSNVNLFQLESDQSYDSYLELFKSEADKKYDNITGKQKPTKDFNKYEVVGEKVLDDSYSAPGSKVSVTDVSPKIMTFVPLDDKTEPYFTNDDVPSVSSTLERENTFQVLNQAKSLAEENKKSTENMQKVNSMHKKSSDVNKKNFNCSLEVLARTPSNFSQGSSKSQTDASRTSFSNAKKLFEALVEANKTEEKSKPKTPPKYPVRETRSSEQSIVNKDAIRGSKNILRETVLLIKDRQNDSTKSKSGED